jgi:hypothetical protein
MGGPNALSKLDSEARGTLTIYAKEPSTSPIVLRTKGRNAVRVELSRPDGTNAFVQREGRGATSLANGKTIDMQPRNALTQRMLHIPIYSLLAEHTDPSIGIEYVGEAQVEGSPAAVVAIALRPKEYPQAGPSDIRTLFFINRGTGFVSKIEYTAHAENNPSYTQRIERFYSDYRLVDGIWVPFRQRTYTDGKLKSELALSSLVFNVGLAENLFDLPKRGDQ